jgi:Na+/H+ antiporter NhaD/arsenite permease-like protein
MGRPIVQDNRPRAVLRRLGPASLIALFLLVPVREAQSGTGQTNEDVTLTVIGRVVNTQESAVDEAEVSVFVGSVQQEIAVGGDMVDTTSTNEGGFFVVDLTLPRDEARAGTLAIQVSRSGYRTVRQGLPRQEIACVADQCYVRAPTIVLPRIFNPAFFIATGVFIVVFGLISFNVLHETIAAFLGAAAMLGVTYFAGSFDADFWIIGFHRAIGFIDFDVIFLLLTMMIFMAIMSETGVFQWLALQAFRLSRGRSFLAAMVLIAVTGTISAVLNDTTVMLLMTPITIQIALALDIHPAAIVIPEVLASNIGGAATLIGTPPNTIIGSYVGLSFNQFLVNMLPIAVIGMLLLLGMTRWLYRDEFEKEGEGASPALIKRLEDDARITNPQLLRQSLILLAVTLILFFIEDLFHMPPAVVAILGSTVLLLWVRPDVSDMLREVDWTTLVFFMSLFMMVGGIQEVGLIQLIAQGVRNLAGESLMLATLLMIWVSAIASAIVANIPYAAAIVPVAVYLTLSLPGSENNVLYWALALGAGLGGNATYIGSAPNIVAMGIMDRAGFRQSFWDFSKVGIPVTFVTLLVPTLWILVRYFWLNF